MDEEHVDSNASQTPTFSRPVQDFVDAVLDAAREAEVCLKTGNKAAGRRARKSLSEVKKAITPLRDTILAVMKGEAGQQAEPAEG